MAQAPEGTLSEGDSVRAPTEWQRLPWGTECLYGGRSWTLDEEEPLEKGLPQDKEYHGFMMHMSKPSPSWETVASTRGLKSCGYREAAGFL